MVEILASTRTLPLIQDKLSTLTLEVEQMSRGLYNVADLVLS